MFAPALGIAALSLGVFTTAMALPVIYNAPVDSGAAAFDRTVSTVGGVLHAQSLTGVPEYLRSQDLGPFTVSTNDGNWHPVDMDYLGLGRNGQTGALTGPALTILPTRNAPSSGMSFTFDQPINAFGLEVGDWATCCFASALYIAFDGGATRLVASASKFDDNPGYGAYGKFTNFVAGIDTTGTFSRVTFYGDGVGEYLVAGGTIRYATLPLNSVTGSVADSVSAVPEPDRWAMMLAGLLGVAWITRRRTDGRE